MKIERKEIFIEILRKYIFLWGRLIRTKLTAKQSMSEAIEERDQLTSKLNFHFRAIWLEQEHAHNKPLYRNVLKYNGLY